MLRARPGWKDPIVVIGAGPVGLSAALGLSHYDVPCIVLDDAEGTATEGSRAILMEQHSMEALGAWSTVGWQMAQQGLTLTGGRVFFQHRELYRTVNAPPEADALYPRFVNISQSSLEQLQYQALQAMPCCRVLWQHRVTGIEQDEHMVHIAVTMPDGVGYVHAPYVLVADGARSTVRQSLGLQFPGESRDHHFLILDVRMQLETPSERWFWFDPPFNPGRTALLHPQPDSIYRLDYQLPPDTDLEAIKQPEALHQRVVATIGERPYEIVWKSIYTYQQRMLERFKVGRLFFLGDAAHLMAPFGARGLNSGVQDAWNLVWKLVLVRAGLAPDSLLTTYHDERHPAAVENLRLTDETMRFLVPESGWPRWKRDLILRASLPLPWMRRYVNAGHMSNPFVYRASPVVSEDPHLHASGRELDQMEHMALTRFAHGPVAGALAPSITLTDAQTNAPVPLLECFGHGFVVLYFCSDPQAGLDALAAIRPLLPVLPLNLYLITSQPWAECDPEGVQILLDSEAKGAIAYHTGRRTLYLVRPDRHIAARRFNSDLTDLPSLLHYAIGGMLNTQSLALHS